MADLRTTYEILRDDLESYEALVKAEHGTALRLSETWNSKFAANQDDLDDMAQSRSSFSYYRFVTMRLLGSMIYSVM